ncbi:hydrolase [Pandoraea sp. PE-S2R-1]|uniref:hydrolase n=1 Tax=Pandoraea sp. PE-S2R-1 TaxID=1986994 RepID=UPI000B404851|nr:hydrolase [Pandoraea sp. PE-S2R-1]
MKITPYHVGPTMSFSCRLDPRFSYCLYVPRGYADPARPRCRILLAVHGTERANQRLRDRFADFAERDNCIVLAPLFPAGMTGDDNIDAYKYLAQGDLRYDLIAKDMIDEVAYAYDVSADRMLVFGFSGGAHFAHRFLYGHASRVRAASIAAPGGITLPDAEHPWWIGLQDFEKRFGRPVDWAALKSIVMHLVVGAEDTNPQGMIQSPSHPYWMPGADALGKTRVERLRRLYDAMVALGVDTRYEALPGVRHEMEPLVDAAQAFFATVSR